jgi:hypothetical protein
VRDRKEVAEMEKQVTENATLHVSLEDITFHCSKFTELLIILNEVVEPSDVPMIRAMLQAMAGLLLDASDRFPGLIFAPGCPLEYWEAMIGKYLLSLNYFSPKN